MLRSWWLIALSCLIVGCLEFGKTYRHTDGGAIPEAAIATWIGQPLPNSYGGLRYDIIGDTPDRQVAIAVQVSESYYKTVIVNLVPYEQVKDSLPSQPGDYGAGRYDFIQAPGGNTTVWVSREGFYRRYVWYQNRTLYIFYSEM